MGIPDEKLAHLADQPLPPGVYSDDEAAIIRYAQKSTMMQPIDDSTYAALTRHFSVPQIIDISLAVGLAQMINRFHATFLTVLGDYIVQANALADAAPGACPISYPVRPG